MKTIAQVIKAIRAGDVTVDSRESTWAESKWWLSRKEGRATQEDVIAIRQILINHKRLGRVELQTEEMDGFAGIFLAFPKNDKAARLIEAGIDPTDLED